MPRSVLLLITPYRGPSSVQYYTDSVAGELLESENRTPLVAVIFRRMFRSLSLVSECVGSMTCDAPNAFTNEFNGLFRLRGGLREPADAKNLVSLSVSVGNMGHLDQCHQ